MPDTQDSDKVKYLKSLLGKVSQATLGFGDDKETPDAIEPVSSPIDLVAGAAGAKLGGGLAKDAGTILSNQVGSIGSNVNPVTNRLAPIMESQSPQVGSPIAQEAIAKAEAQQVANQALSGQSGADITSLGKAQQNYNRSIDQADRMRQQVAQARAAGLKKLSGG